ncbi:nucleotidyl transferase AbiEii/AbiGii toxin family protein [Puteibacter caeruleilacunae]|nr:nucleotidyl transferase AbiEii/AbiGii toxin family protein [Puteibacter caeruleilacunae]
MKIYKETVSDLLWETLLKLMDLAELNPFRLVGGTALSLKLGHRISIDIDLFTDAEYSTIDFDKIDELLEKNFAYIQVSFSGNNSFGKSYYIGQNSTDLVKLDMFYTDPFIFPPKIVDGIRFAHMNDIVAMKLEAIGNAGRKKDFWDLHELLDQYTLQEIFTIHQQRYPYSYSKEELIKKMGDFRNADQDFEPICLKNKYWELIKLDIEEAIQHLT